MKLGTGIIEIITTYMPIIIGTVLGTFAHFGRLFSRGEIPTGLQALGFFFQLGFIGLLAVWATRNMGIIDRDSMAMVAAIFALSAHEVVQFAKRRGWRVILKDTGIDDEELK